MVYFPGSTYIPIISIGYWSDASKFRVVIRVTSYYFSNNASNNIYYEMFRAYLMSSDFRAVGWWLVPTI